MDPTRNMRLGMAVAVLIGGLDLVSKWWIVDKVMQPPRMIPVTSFFNLVLGHNRGVSFGMFNSDNPMGRWLLTGLAVAIVIGLLIWMWRADRAWIAIALGLIVGGAVGNVYDRVTIGAVVDFLDFHAAGYHWPTFNIADIGITFGAIGLIWDSFAHRADEADG